MTSFLAAIASWGLHKLPFELVTEEHARKQLPATVGGGMAVFDFDGDGRLDIFFANGAELSSGRKMGAQHWNRLLKNEGGMQFSDVTANAGLAGAQYDFGAAAGDYDSDGDIDLLVSGLRGLSLFRNNGDGTFTDATTASRLDIGGRWSVAAAWFDMENDGDLDLFVVNYVRWDPTSERECIVSGKPDFCHPRFYESVPNALFRNNGDGTFTDVSEVSGIAKHAGKGMSAAAADFDGDGFTDLYVTNDRAFAFLFRNHKGVRFEEVAFDWGVAVPEDGKPVSGMGVDAQDYDNDGRPDLVYTALRDETFPLYRNAGGTFTESTASSRLSVLSRNMSGWGVAFADFDNDGWKDIAVACSDALSATGGRGSAVMEPPAWFRNSGDGRFEAGPGWGSAPRALHRGLIAADMDNDGCVDVVLTALNTHARVLRNPCSDGRNWLKVQAPVLGTRVRVGKQWRHATSSVGYASSYVGPLHFGVGAAKSIDVEALLPGGGRVEAKSAVNRTWVVEATRGATR
jgi:hypothetical protein